MRDVVVAVAIVVPLHLRASRVSSGLKGERTSDDICEKNCFFYHLLQGFVKGVPSIHVNLLSQFFHEIVLKQYQKGQVDLTSKEKSTNGHILIWKALPNESFLFLFWQALDSKGSYARTVLLPSSTIWVVDLVTETAFLWAQEKLLKRRIDSVLNRFVHLLGR